MSVLGWIILLLGSAAAAGFSYYTYFRREPAGRGRLTLMALRTATLILIILLLVDPQLGARTRSDRNATRVVLDASLSMLPRTADSAVWQAALREARARSTGPIIVGGSAPRMLARDSIAQLKPAVNTSRMLPALQTAAEGGAQRVVLITDGGVEDVADIARWLPRLGVQVDVRPIDIPATANRALAELAAPSWAEAGKPVQIRVGVTARGSSADSSARLIVRQGSEIVARSDVALPADGRMTSVTLSFPANGPAEGGLVRFDVAFEEADAISDDDVRSAYIFISEEPAGVAIVSFLPDWEPRFLHPVVEQALGLPVRTFLRVPNGAYFRAGAALAAGTRVEEPAVRAAVAQADLLILHGVTESAPSWWRTAASSARRVIIFPADALGEPYEVSAPVPGDWYVSSEVPPSPIAAFLQNIDVGEVPPLQSVSATSSAAGWTPLQLGRSRRGGRAPALLAQESNNRRTAIALGTGYWRWAFRGGTSRDLYDRMWGALAGWMVQDQPEIAGAAIRPVRRTVPRGEPMRWLVPGLTPDSLSLRMIAGERVVQDNMSRARGDTAMTASLPPGHYSYEARAFGGGQIVAQATGPITVESYSPEFMRAAADLSVLRATPSALGEPTRRGGRPLHASAWPYVLVVLLLCAEWIFRRRWGLR
ncbi:MAG TPA: hypothetical protein VFO52_05725 [Longimicrobiales bacterium]|nr:hypothetical protein [Longimicrobiales bacterium]